MQGRIKKDSLIEKCHDKEDKNKRKRPRDMFRTIIELTIQFIPKTGTLKGKAGELINEKDKNF